MTYADICRRTDGRTDRQTVKTLLAHVSHDICCGEGNENGGAKRRGCELNSGYTPSQFESNCIDAP